MARSPNRKIEAVVVEDFVDNIVMIKQMISKQIIGYVVIGVFLFMALLQLIMFLKTSNCLCLSSDIDTWSNYGSAFSSWSLPFLTL